jgi:hypothetical protein
LKHSVLTLDFSGAFLRGSFLAPLFLLDLYFEAMLRGDIGTIGWVGTLVNDGLELMGRIVVVFDLRLSWVR